MTTAPRPLSSSQRQRYARHVLLPEVGVAGQVRLLDACARVLGEGVAAQEAALYLAAAGVGRLVLDPRLSALVERIAAMNPDVHVAFDGPGLVVEPREPARRAAGADAALQALLTILGLATRGHSEMP